jgi:hypothetical protein
LCAGRRATCDGPFYHAIFSGSCRASKMSDTKIRLSKMR